MDNVLLVERSRMDVENIDRVVKRKATFSDIDLLSDVTKQIEGHTICAFGEGSAWRQF